MIPEILIMISGRGSNLRAIIEQINIGILKDRCRIKEVFSNKQDAPGLKIAENSGISTHCINSKGKKRSVYDALLLEYLKKNNPDFIVLAGYMRIIPKEIIREFEGRIINIHPADTKEHQGLHGYDWAWENGLDKTKITVHFVDEGLDTGSIIDQAVVDLKGVASLEEVEQRGLAVEHEFYSRCLLEVLKDINR